MTNFKHKAVPESNKNIYIPKYGPGSKYPGSNFVYYTYAKQRQEQLDLFSPETSLHQETFRAHITKSIGLTQRCATYDFWKVGGKWRGIKYDLIIKYDTWLHEEYIKESQSFSLDETGNWDLFHDMYKTLGLPNLKSEEEIGDFYDWCRLNRKRT
ncbi:MAG: hypothetical protein HRU15_07385, partial [Planctomycetes bacterium]|nr:hypothetical protein [Planctomycetota bacterium]